jgi:hypothetical protein
MPAKSRKTTKKPRNRPPGSCALRMHRRSGRLPQSLKADGPERATLLARLRQHAAQIKSIAD